MKVFYDISVLGSGFSDESARTGVFRVVDHVAQGLAQSRIDELYFCTSGDVQNLQSCKEYKNSLPALRPVRMSASRTSSSVCTPRHLLKKFEIAAEMRMVVPAQNGTTDALHRSRTGSPWLARISRNVAIKLGRTIDSIAQPLPLRELQSAKIFHSPWNPIPQRVRQTKTLQRFITIYDVLPIIHPEWFTDWTRGHFSDILDSIGPSDWVHCISQSTRNDLLNAHPKVDPARVFVSHIAADERTFHPCLIDDELARVRKKYRIPGSQYFLSVCTFEPRKNLDRVIRTFERLCASGDMKDVALVLVGSKGWKDEQIASALADASSASKRIIVTGFVPDHDLAALYSGAIAFVYPSLYEGFGLPPLEAMRCGLPVITSNSSSLPEVVGDAGIMIEPTDSDALSQSMLNLYGDTELRNLLSAKSIERAEQFNWEQCVERIIQQYERAART